MLGIPDYEPNFFDRVDIFIKVFSDQLNQTIGLTLEDYWLMWQTQDNEWYNDGPVILKIGNRQFEFTAYKLDEFSLTFDKIDLNKKLDWYGAGADIPLVWKNKCNTGMNKLIGRKITDISVVAYNFISTVIDDKVNPKNIGRIDETGFMLHGIEFKFEKRGLFDNNNFLQIFNALDSNGVANKEQKGNKQYQKISIVKTTL
ncbi:MAG: hypothetical protein KBB37_13180 [Bacteroidia bacterium]|nr:hypothetical protein [Bacteroidia bacterium]